MDNAKISTLPSKLQAKLKANPTQTILRNESQVANEDYIYYRNPVKIDVSVPNEFNGKEVWKDFLSPVLDQGKCGSCWDSGFDLFDLKKYLLK